jgi:hypothetical protein
MGPSFMKMPFAIFRSRDFPSNLFSLQIVPQLNALSIHFRKSRTQMKLNALSILCLHWKCGMKTAIASARKRAIAVVDMCVPWVIVIVLSQSNALVFVIRLVELHPEYY